MQCNLNLHNFNVQYYDMLKIRMYVDILGCKIMQESLPRRLEAPKRNESFLAMGLVISTEFFLEPFAATALIRFSAGTDFGRTARSAAAICLHLRRICLRRCFCVVPNSSRRRHRRDETVSSRRVASRRRRRCDCELGQWQLPTV